MFPNSSFISAASRKIKTLFITYQWSRQN
jgi:hypothetical protein